MISHHSVYRTLFTHKKSLFTYLTYKWDRSLMVLWWSRLRFCDAMRKKYRKFLFTFIDEPRFVLWILSWRGDIVVGFFVCRWMIKKFNVKRLLSFRRRVCELRLKFPSNSSAHLVCLKLSLFVVAWVEEEVEFLIEMRRETLERRLKW